MCSAECALWVNFRVQSRYPDIPAVDWRAPMLPVTSVRLANPGNLIIPLLVTRATCCVPWWIDCNRKWPRSMSVQSSGQQKETKETYSEERAIVNDLVDAPKRKVALLLAFCGKNYYGLQLNRGDTSLPTIEGALFGALVKARLVPKICMEKSQQMKYSSSSRTDKGVSTCGMVVSLKLRMCNNAMDLINQQLPSDIRVLDLRKTTKSFHAKTWADKRTYSYTMPTFPFDSSVSSDDISSYRIDKEKLKRVKSYLYRYKGTHSFHNFTSGKRMGEPSAKRYILDFWTEEPFIHESMEYITLKVKGQSFMIHQIRKMIGLVIVLVSERAPEQHYIRAFSEPLEDIPKAPGSGLLLEQVHYDSYNKKNNNLLDWSSTDDQAREFKEKYILPHIFKEEIENKSMLGWIESLSNHDFTGEKAKEQWNQFLLDKEEKEKQQNGDEDLGADSTGTNTNNIATLNNKDLSDKDNLSPQPPKKKKLEDT